MEMSQYHELVTFLHGERLREDGSNFISWYLYLRTVLKKSNLSFIRKEHVGNPPANDMDARAATDYQNRRRTYAISKSVIETSIPQALREEYAELDTYDRIDELKSLYMHQFRVP